MKKVSKIEVFDGYCSVISTKNGFNWVITDSAAEAEYLAKSYEHTKCVNHPKDKYVIKSNSCSMGKHAYTSKELRNSKGTLIAFYC